jgi:hypothetical protein
MLLSHWDTCPERHCAHIIAGIRGEREREGEGEERDGEEEEIRKIEEGKNEI